MWLLLGTLVLVTVGMTIVGCASHLVRLETEVEKLNDIARLFVEKEGRCDRAHVTTEEAQEPEADAKKDK
jgi:hypothetical protein